MPTSGGLSPQEIEARDRDLRAHDLITKTIRWLAFIQQGGTMVATFTPDQNYMMFGLDALFTINGGYTGYMAVSYAPGVAALASSGSSGVSIVEIPQGSWQGRFYWFEPYGFYLEKNRGLNIFIVPENTGQASFQSVGALNLFLLPTWSQ